MWRQVFLLQLALPDLSPVSLNTCPLHPRSQEIVIIICFSHSVLYNDIVESDWINVLTLTTFSLFLFPDTHISHATQALHTKITILYTSTRPLWSSCSGHSHGIPPHPWHHCMYIPTQGLQHNHTQSHTQQSGVNPSLLTTMTAP